MLFVMGATGRVGGVLVSRLAGKLPVRAASQSPRTSTADIDWVRFDLETSATFAAALDGVSAIFLMRPPQITKRAAFLPFLTAAKDRGIRRIVFLSVMGADSNSILPHYGIERLVEEMDFDWTMIRPSDFMQNLETAHCDGIRTRDEIAVPAGGGRSSFIDVLDIGEVLERVLVDDGHIRKGYTLTGSTALNFEEVAAALTSVLNRTIRYRKIGIFRFLVEQLSQKRPLGITLVMSALYTVQRLGKAATTTRDVEMLLGRTPRDLREYLIREKAVWLT